MMPTWGENQTGFKSEPEIEATPVLFMQPEAHIGQLIASEHTFIYLSWVVDLGTLDYTSEVNVLTAKAQSVYFFSLFNYFIDPLLRRVNIHGFLHTSKRNCRYENFMVCAHDLFQVVVDIWQSPGRSLKASDVDVFKWVIWNKTKTDILLTKTLDDMHVIDDRYYINIYPEDTTTLSGKYPHEGVIRTSDGKDYTLFVGEVIFVPVRIGS